MSVRKNSSAEAVRGADGTRLIVRASGKELLAITRARLTVVKGPDGGKAVELGDRPLADVVIGSDDTCDLVLTDKTVSRRHAEIRATEKGYVLRDLGSRNGVYVGNLLVAEAHVRSVETLVVVGETTLKLQLLGDEVEHELSAAQRFGGVLGRAPSMRQMFSVLERIAPTDNTVLLEGESGTGKEVLAQSIHDASPRAKEPFVVIDCSAIAPSLIESELFGHEKGAFTGATYARAGAIEEAHKGTLFIDEVGELPADMQPKFLRALEQRQIRRVGATSYRDVDVRVIAATHRNLEKMVKDGGFRADLFYRLAVVRVPVPALRHHKEDVAVLAQHFVSERRPGCDIEDVLSPSVLASLEAYAWPGNVRELRNAIDRLLALGDPGLPGVAATSSRAPTAAPVGEYQRSRRDALDRFEREYCELLLAECGGHVTRAAERAGLSRGMFHRLLSKHGIRRDEEE